MNISEDEPDWDPIVSEKPMKRIIGVNKDRERLERIKAKKRKAKLSRKINRINSLRKK